MICNYFTLGSDKYMQCLVQHGKYSYGDVYKLTKQVWLTNRLPMGGHGCCVLPNYFSTLYNFSLD